jgi:hypothetical protein
MVKYEKSNWRRWQQQSSLNVWHLILNNTAKKEKNTYNWFKPAAYFCLSQNHDHTVNQDILAVLCKNGVVKYWCVKNWHFVSRVCFILALCIKDVFYFGALYQGCVLFWCFVSRMCFILALCIKDVFYFGCYNYKLMLLIKKIIIHKQYDHWWSVFFHLYLKHDW